MHRSYLDVLLLLAGLCTQTRSMGALRGIFSGQLNVIYSHRVLPKQLSWLLAELSGNDLNVEMPSEVSFRQQRQF